MLRKTLSAFSSWNVILMKIVKYYIFCRVKNTPKHIGEGQTRWEGPSQLAINCWLCKIFKSTHMLWMDDKAVRCKGKIFYGLKWSSRGRTDLAIHFQPSWPTSSECFSKLLSLRFFQVHSTTTLRTRECPNEENLLALFVRSIINFLL